MKRAIDDRLCENRIALLLGDGYSVTVLDSVSSTNTELWKKAVSGAENGTVLIAKSQTMGKGRMGRSFCSKEGGLYMSLLLRPALSPEDTALITPLAALAVALAIQKNVGKDALIKWVNDVYCDGKKVCGILTEANINPAILKTEFVIVGIGLNVYEPAGGFPEDLKDIATFLLKAEDARDGLMDALVADIVKGITAFTESPFNKEWLREYQRRCFVIGKEIDVYRGNESYGALALGIDDRYALIVEAADGVKHSLNSGEVRVRPKGVKL